MMHRCGLAPGGGLRAAAGHKDPRYGPGSGPVSQPS
jgi:hypothetical protein